MKARLAVLAGVAAAAMAFSATDAEATYSYTRTNFEQVVPNNPANPVLFNNSPEVVAALNDVPPGYMMVGSSSGYGNLINGCGLYTSGNAGGVSSTNANRTSCTGSNGFNGVNDLATYIHHDQGTLLQLEEDTELLVQIVVKEGHPEYEGWQNQNQKEEFKVYAVPEDGDFSDKEFLFKYEDRDRYWNGHQWVDDSDDAYFVSTYTGIHLDAGNYSLKFKSWYGSVEYLAKFWKPGGPPPSIVSEPGSLGVMLSGLLMLAGYTWRRRTQRAE